GNEYKYLLEGARSLGPFIFSESFNPEVAAVKAPIIMYFASCLLENKPFIKYSGENVNIRKFKHAEFKVFNYLRKINLEAYYYICKTDEILCLI
ncbi:MAG: hypothetical protein HUK24_01005, partial [Sphaerochaetaceae bacterium]|nr:hypothetical protein [Sphaerochaetaceae bacterium]